MRRRVPSFCNVLLSMGGGEIGWIIVVMMVCEGHRGS